MCSSYILYMYTFVTTKGVIPLWVGSCDLLDFPLALKLSVQIVCGLVYSGCQPFIASHYIIIVDPLPCSLLLLLSPWCVVCVLSPSTQGQCDMRQA